jgi:hypothetical protein
MSGFTINNLCDGLCDLCALRVSKTTAPEPMIGAEEAIQ